MADHFYEYAILETQDSQSDECHDSEDFIDWWSIVKV